MPMSKRKTIYKPKKGKRLSRKKLYKLSKKMKMHGGNMFDDFKKFLTGGEVPDLSGETDHLNNSTKDSDSMDVSPEQEQSSDSMDVSPEEQKSSDSMDVSPEQEQSSDSMDVSPEVDSSEKSSNLATKVSEFGTLMGDSAKNVFNEGMETMTKPSDSVDENISTDVTLDNDTNDVEELKKQIVILKDENNDLKTKLIDKLEKENDTLKHGTSNYDNEVPPLEESSLNNEFDENNSMNVLPDQENNTMDVSPILDQTTQEQNTMGSEDSEQLSTIDLDSSPNSNETIESPPDFGEQVSTIEQQETPQDSNMTNNESPSLGGKDRKKKNKKKKRTTRKKH